MPGKSPHDAAQRGRLIQGLFWGGVGLAPLAILVLLFGSSTGALRIAVTLCVLTVVSLAMSMALRPSAEMVRVDIEHRVLDEVERARVRAREDVSVAARNTHRVLSEKMQGLAETIDMLRYQLDELQAGADLGAPAIGPGPSSSHTGTHGMVRRTETVHVTRRTTMVGGDEDKGGTVYGSPAVIDRRDRPAVRGGAHHAEPDDYRRGDDWDDRESRWEGMSSGDRYAAVRSDDHGRELRMGERRSSVRSDGRGTEMRVEDRWSALRREDEPGDRNGYGESEWEATFRSLNAGPNVHRSGPVAALPAAAGDSAARYLDEDRSGTWSRGRAREADRHHDDRHHDDRRHDDRRHDDRDYDDRGRGYDDRGDDRRGDHRGDDHRGDHRGDDGRGHDDRRDRGYDDRSRGYDDRRSDERGYDDRGGYGDRRPDDRGGYGDRGRDDRGHDDRRDRGYDDRDRGHDSRSRDERPSYEDRRPYGAYDDRGDEWPRRYDDRERGRYDR